MGGAVEARVRECSWQRLHHDGTLASLDLVGQLRLWPSFAAGPKPNAPSMHMQFCHAGRWLAIARRGGCERLLDPVDGGCVLRVPVGQLSRFFAHPSLPVIAWVDEDCPAVLDLRDLERPLAGHLEFFAAKSRGEAMGR